MKPQRERIIELNKEAHALAEQENADMLSYILETALAEAINERPPQDTGTEH